LAPLSDSSDSLSNEKRSKRSESEQHLS
jgi:hypothetical protein